MRRVLFDASRALLASFLIRSGLLGNQLQNGGHVFVQLDGNREFAQRAKRFVQLHFAAIHIEALLLERFADVTGRDRTEKLIVFSRTALKRNRETVKLLG